MSVESAATGRLPTRTRLAYGAPSFGLALVFVPMLVYLPQFYSDVVGVPVIWIGIAFIGGRVLDAITDPIVGVLSDRSRAASGRRRPWILWGSLPLALFSLAIYIPPAGVSETTALVWAGIAIFGWFLAFTAVGIPYRALGPELTDDYDERTSLFAVREGVLVVGTLVAAVGPGVVRWALGLPDTAEGERAKFLWYVASATPVLVITCLLCTRGVTERFGTQTAGGLTAGSFVRQARQALSNRPFRILLSAFVVVALGGGLPAVLISYFTRYVLHSDQIAVYLLVYFSVGLAAMPGWIRVSAAIGKKSAWLSAMAVNAGFFSFVAFVGPGDDVLYGVLVGLSGIAGVAVLAMPYSMQADVIDHDELATGQRREGLYGGLWSVAEKTAAGFGLGLSMFALDVAGYQPNVEQSPVVLLVLRGLYIGVPVACTVAGFLIALRYPLDRSEHTRIAAALRGRGRPSGSTPRPDDAAR